MANTTYKRIALNPNIGGGGGGGLPPYQAFFEVADWTLEGDYYSIEVPAAVHGRGNRVAIQAYKTDALIFRLVDVGAEQLSSGTVKIFVASSPDLRFEGKLIIVGE